MGRAARDAGRGPRARAGLSRERRERALPRPRGGRARGAARPRSRDQAAARFAPTPRGAAMARGLRIAAIFALGAAVYVASQRGYLPSELAGLFLVGWAFALRSLSVPNKEELAKSINERIAERRGAQQAREGVQETQEEPREPAPQNRQRRRSRA